MIRRSPAEKYIEYLLVHPDGYSNDTILELLQLKHLDFLGPRYLERLRANLHPPAIFTPGNRFHQPSSRFLAAHRIYYLYHPDKHTSDALKILDDPRGKEAVESMSIVRDSERLCAHRMQGFGFKVSPKAIERYRFFFFNVDLVDSTELQALMSLRASFVPSTSDSYDDQARTALKKASYRDPRRALAANPIPQIASMLNQIRMGYLPNQADLTRLLSLAHQVATVNSLNTALVERGPQAAAETRDWATAAKMFAEMLAEVGRPDAELQRDLQQFALKTENGSLPHIAELSGGNHTVDLQPAELLEGSGEDREHYDS